MLLTEAVDVVVVAHVDPDADALGSALALGLALERRGSRVAVGVGAPEQVPASLAGLPGQHLICAVRELPRSADLVVTVDVNAVGRLGALADLALAAPHLLVIDHHASNTWFGTDHLVDPGAESTTVLIAALLDRIGAQIDLPVAANLYAGLATDSVGFRYASPAGHRLAARLLETGLSADALMGPITDAHPLGWLAMLAAVLGRAEVLSFGPAAGRLIFSSVTRADAEGLHRAELDPVIDVLRGTAGAHVAAVFKEVTNGWQVSLRSVEQFDVAAVAVHFGGGGHRRAAGYTWSGALGPAIDALRAELAARP